MGAIALPAATSAAVTCSRKPAWYGERKMMTVQMSSSSSSSSTNGDAERQVSACCKEEPG